MLLLYITDVVDDMSLLTTIELMEHAFFVHGCMLLISSGGHTIHSQGSFFTTPCHTPIFLLQVLHGLLTLGAHAQRGLQVCHSVRPSVRPFVCLSVCYHVFCHYAQQDGQKAIPTGSVPHWLDFKNSDFRKSTAFKSYGLKTKRTSQYANEHGLPRPDSARFRARWRQYT